MDENTNVTPQPRRRLGLRLIRKANTTPGLRQQIKQPAATPQSKEEKSSDAIATPRALPLQLKANSTICRRPGLARKRKDLTKKRLEFAATEKLEERPKTPEQESSTESTKPQLNTWREREIIELEADIDIWRNGFIAAMDDLQKLVQPRVTKQSLLAQLGIPLEMLKYLDED
ncbi:uncharacterized protein LOC108660055 [Drosophila navojoa]|uniref:uncharacterized protein LOC108660055 n=1 Tax=Drosophila navojoa TaxID=7232 RepID=UPI000847A885|nr:uncharacterized protein LOC108660055 [Drosophila navojoa]